MKEFKNCLIIHSTLVTVRSDKIPHLQKVRQTLTTDNTEQQEIECIYSESRAVFSTTRTVCRILDDEFLFESR